MQRGNAQPLSPSRARHSLVSNLSHRICQCGIAKLWHGQPHLQSGHFPELSHRIKACPAAAPGKKETIHYGATAISLKGKVKPAVASTLKRIHQNLGHPPNSELVRDLRLGGAGDDIARAAEHMVFRTYERSTKVKSSPTLRGLEL